MEPCRRTLRREQAGGRVDARRRATDRESSSGLSSLVPCTVDRQDAGEPDEMECDMVSTRFPSPLRNGGTDREGALRIAFVGTFPPTRYGLATFTESMMHSISQHLLTATVPWKARGTDNSGARGLCPTTGRATYGAWSGRERS